MDGSRWLSAGTIGSECYGRMQTRRVLTAVVVTRRSCIDSKVRSKGKKEVGLVKLLVLSLLEVHSAVQITQARARFRKAPRVHGALPSPTSSWHARHTTKDTLLMYRKVDHAPCTSCPPAAENNGDMLLPVRRPQPRPRAYTMTLA